MFEPAASNVLADARIPVLYTFAISFIFRDEQQRPVKPLPCHDPRSPQTERGGTPAAR